MNRLLNIHSHGSQAFSPLPAALFLSARLDIRSFPVRHRQCPLFAPLSVHGPRLFSHHIPSRLPPRSPSHLSVHGQPFIKKKTQSGPVSSPAGVSTISPPLQFSSHWGSCPPEPPHHPSKTAGSSLLYCKHKCITGRPVEKHRLCHCWEHMTHR